MIQSFFSDKNLHWRTWIQSKSNIIRSSATQIRRNQTAKIVAKYRSILYKVTSGRKINLYVHTSTTFNKTKKKKVNKESKEWFHYHSIISLVEPFLFCFLRHASTLVLLRTMSRINHCFANNYIYATTISLFQRYSTGRQSTLYMCWHAWLIICGESTKNTENNVPTLIQI